jgi:hypothetical protein
MDNKLLQPVRTIVSGGLDYYSWTYDLHVDISACDDGTNTNRGVFASRKLLAGTHIPILGYIKDVPRMSSENYSFSCNGKLVDGHPTLHPHNGIAAHGLSIAMLINEPPITHTKKPNVYHLEHWLVLVQTVQPGEELFLYYGNQYPRETITVDVGDDYSGVVPYKIGKRAHLAMNESEFSRVQSARNQIGNIRKQNLLKYYMTNIINKIYPKPFPLLSDWYIAGRRTGLGYSYHVNDENPRLVVRSSPWLLSNLNCPRNLCRGLFVGQHSSFHKNEIVTTYSGPIVDQKTSTDISKTHLKTIMRQTYAIDGYKHPKTHHGLGQFINDIHNSNKTANVCFQTVSGKNIIVQEYNNHGVYINLPACHECMVVALRDIEPDEELFISIADHRNQFLLQQPSYVINRQMDVAIGSYCLIRYRDNEDEPFIPALISLIGRSVESNNTYNVRWFSVVDEYKTMEEYVTLSFLPGWVDADDLHETSGVQYSLEKPGQSYIPYIASYTMTTRDVLVHGIQLSPQNCLQIDLQTYILNTRN